MYYLDEFWIENGDPRVLGYPFLSTARPACLLLLSYLAFVFLLGPRFMATRPPYSLKLLMLVYNITISLLNVFFFIRILLLHNFGLDSFQTDFPSLLDTSPPTQAIIQLHYFYVLSKFLDLLDTVFMVLRKKQAHVTALHVYHHISVPVESWIYFRLCATECVAIPFALLNSFVHSIMYAYYGLATLGPQMQPYLTWKRYLTQLQIAQFIVIVLFSIYFLLNQRGYPLYFPLNMLLQSALYIILFTRFYLNTYTKTTAKSD